MKCKLVVLILFLSSLFLTSCNSSDVPIYQEHNKEIRGNILHIEAITKETDEEKLKSIVRNVAEKYNDVDAGYVYIRQLVDAPATMNARFALTDTGAKLTKIEKGQMSTNYYYNGEVYDDKVSSMPPELIKLAKNEQLYLNKTILLIAHIKDTYSNWDNGKISRDQLTKELQSDYDQFKEMREQYDAFRKENKFSKKALNHLMYQNGLYYGYSLRSTVYAFLSDVVIMGYKEGTKKLSDKDLRNSYHSRIEVGYERKLSILQSALDKIKNEGLLE